MLTEIAYSNIRNLSEGAFSPGFGVNLITGDNAAGKSSVLEAIHLLSLGRSFRTSQLDRVVSSTESECWVRGSVRRDGRITRIGFQRAGKRNRFRIDGTDATSVAQTARTLPVQIIHPDSHRLLTSGPAHRRAFLDWGCFYADAGFHAVWRQYRRALAQYNCALKGRIDRNILHGLEQALAVHGEDIDRRRRFYLSELLASLSSMDPLWPEPEDRVLVYEPGWHVNTPLLDALGKHRQRAIRFGSAMVGPHRADLTVLHRGEPAATALSRGQIKRVTVALMLTQMTLYESNAGHSCTLMIDDIASELDAHSVRLVADAIGKRSGQCFVSALSLDDAQPFMHGDHRMFHVEHGRLSELL
ncbi:DNA replication/repair protein RecF [Acidihalobacter prosperus]|uniref:DNA replication and repair protein RecF n=1 Tax=Acidihalobacter prosperus TaxID=160660 RepID=A0A1A6C4V2_9GAMM|nr:DNA replication/repair protein RecF [Acidihalobacter prosperus]OBS09575.1 DNA recombination and repair protein RecF [Acidihalobacter prosperus]